MRPALAVLLLVACGGSSKQPAQQQGVPLSLSHHATHTCQHAVRGLSGATRGVREPDVELDDAVVARCERESWATAAIDCFAEMKEGELGRCAQQLDDREREWLFSMLGGGDPGTAGVAVAKARLDAVKVGIATCDQFVATVRAALDCDALAIEMRLNLASETAQFWSLPTDRLGPDDRQRMSQVCVSSLDTLVKETTPVGCGL